MSQTVDWFKVAPGNYTGTYIGRRLEIRRNPQASDPRRYVVAVDGRELPHPCWTTNEAKTKAIQAAQQGPAPRALAPPVPEPEFAEVFDVAPAAALVPYEPPEPPAEALVEIPYTIEGTLRAVDIGQGMTHLRSMVDLLREYGVADGRARLPPVVKF